MKAEILLSVISYTVFQYNISMRSGRFNRHLLVLKYNFLACLRSRARSRDLALQRLSMIGI